VSLKAEEDDVEGLTPYYMPSSGKIIVEATARWCRYSQSEPDQLLMMQAITLFNRGHDTTESLFDALKQVLIN
jgi:hypothetical protein